MQLGAYRLLQRIGEGGMGAVWLAEHAMLGRRAAIKVLHPGYSNRPEIVTRFFNEARAATSIGDPGIVQIFDYGHHVDGSAYIVMELLNGEPLDRRLARQGAMGLPEALRILRQVASTLGAAHAHGIVHRDLKPENIYIVRDPEVIGGERAKVLDFGIAKLTIGDGLVKTHTSAVMGTPMYMSPEQCRGAGAVDQRSDVYALGCVLFALLTGRPPFYAEGSGEIIAMHLREPPPIPSSMRAGIPSHVDALVLRCLSKAPEQRFAHGGELAYALGAMLEAMQHGGQLSYLPVSTSPTSPIVALSTSPSPVQPSTASPSTTLSTSAGAVSRSEPPKRSRATLFVAVSIVFVGGISALALTRNAESPVPPQSAESPKGSDSVAPVEPAATPTPPPIAEPAPATPPVAQPTSDEIAASTIGVLTKFVEWSRAHHGAPCPDIAALTAAPLDPWGHAYRLTCSDQPADQIVGVISSGPDGMPATDDDVASWRLSGEVTSVARGSRWAAAVPKPPPRATDAPRKPRRGGAIETDDNGIPTKR